MSLVRMAALGLALTGGAACTTILGDDFTLGPSGSGGGTTHGGEDCVNGADDDADGQTDCADSDCQGPFVCVPPAPAGFSGPVIRAEAAFGTAPACLELFAAATIGYASPSDEPLACEACTCSTPDVSCMLSDVDAYAAIGCAVPPGPATLAQSTTCMGTGGAGDTFGSFLIAPPTASVGACQPQGGGVAMVPEPTWESESLLCSPSVSPGAGCPADDLCLPRGGEAGFSVGYCVFAPDDIDCPAPYLDKFLLSADVAGLVDDRSCSACACATGTGSCTATTKIYGSLNVCNGSLKATVPNDGQCHDASNQFSNAVELIATIDEASGSCPATGGEPQGEVTASGPFMTVCCTPG